MADCPFCALIADERQNLVRRPHALAIPDRFPVSDGHTLVIPRRHVARMEELDAEEWTSLFALVHEVSRELGGRESVAGINVGFNSGAAAGQTVGHAHVHLIPRRKGDVADPRGGVRWVIPDRADYWGEG